MAKPIRDNTSSAAGKWARRKGRRCEQEAVHKCRELWYAGEDCIRSAQANGKFTADILGALAGAHVEVKARKGIGAARFMDQAIKDSLVKTMKDSLLITIPIVLMKEDRGEWLVMFRMKDSLGFAAALMEQFDKECERKSDI